MTKLTGNSNEDWMILKPVDILYSEHQKMHSDYVLLRVPDPESVHMLKISLLKQ